MRCLLTGPVSKLSNSESRDCQMAAGVAAVAGRRMFVDGRLPNPFECRTLCNRSIKLNRFAFDISTGDFLEPQDLDAQEFERSRTRAALRYSIRENSGAFA